MNPKEAGIQHGVERTIRVGCLVHYDFENDVVTHIPVDAPKQRFDSSEYLEKKEPGLTSFFKRDAGGNLTKLAEIEGNVRYSEILDIRVMDEGQLDLDLIDLMANRCLKIGHGMRYDGLENAFRKHKEDIYLGVALDSLSFNETVIEKIELRKDDISKKIVERLEQQRNLLLRTLDYETLIKVYHGRFGCSDVGLKVIDLALEKVKEGGTSFTFNKDAKDLLTSPSPGGEYYFKIYRRLIEQIRSGDDWFFLQKQLINVRAYESEHLGFGDHHRDIEVFLDWADKNGEYGRKYNVAIGEYRKWRNRSGWTCYTRDHIGD